LEQPRDPTKPAPVEVGPTHIAIVQARHHPPARTYLARKTAEGKTPRVALPALKRHLANVSCRRLYAWAETTPALNT